MFCQMTGRSRRPSPRTSRQRNGLPYEPGGLHAATDQGPRRNVQREHPPCHLRSSVPGTDGVANATASNAPPQQEGLFAAVSGIRTSMIPLDPAEPGGLRRNGMGQAGGLQVPITTQTGNTTDTHELRCQAAACSVCLARRSLRRRGCGWQRQPWLLGAAGVGTRRAAARPCTAPRPGVWVPLARQLGRGRADGVGLGPDQVVAWGDVVTGERGGDLGRRTARASRGERVGEGDQLLARGGAQRIAGRSGLQQPQHGGRRGRPRRPAARPGTWTQVLAEPV